MNYRHRRPNENLSSTKQSWPASSLSGRAQHGFHQFENSSQFSSSGRNNHQNESYPSRSTRGGSQNRSFVWRSNNFDAQRRQAIRNDFFNTCLITFSDKYVLNVHRNYFVYNFHSSFIQYFIKY